MVSYDINYIECYKGTYGVVFTVSGGGGGTNIPQSVFKSNGLAGSYQNVSYMYWRVNGDSNTVWYEDVPTEYQNQVCTITITGYDSSVDVSDVLNWLQANATKQNSAAVSTITFTIDGTSYEAEEGMTWAEWCESDYNTGGWKSGGSTYIYQEVSAGSNVLFEATSNTITANGVYTAENDS